MIIYLLTNRITSKSYIGQTVHTLSKRIWQHCQPKSGCVVLYRAIKKYGIESFDQQVLVEVDSIEELNYYEEHLIARFQTLVPNGYNLMTGGCHSRPTQVTIDKRNATCSDPTIRIKMGSGNRGRVWTDEERQQQSERLKGRVVTAQHRANLSKSAMGRKMPPITDAHREKLRQASLKMWKTREKVFAHHTPEAKEKIRVASTGRLHSEEAKQKIREFHIGRTHTAETKAKISQNRAGKVTGKDHPMFCRTHSDEAKQKISEAGLGREHSDEVKQKIAEASKKMWETRLRTVPYKSRPSMQGKAPWNKGVVGASHTGRSQTKDS